MIWPEAIDEIIRPSTIGSIANPDSVGVTPFTICRYSGMVSIAPNMPKPTSTDRIADIENTREPNSFIGRIASLPIARSTMMNAIRPAAPMP
ncbi:hypothetical protein QP157_00205 [Sphingomonas sp. LR61]